MNAKSAKQMDDALSEAAEGAKKIHALAYAAHTLLMFNSDLTIDEWELKNRVSYLIDTIISESSRLADYCDGDYQHSKTPQEVN